MLHRSFLSESHFFRRARLNERAAAAAAARGPAQASNSGSPHQPQAGYALATGEAAAYRLRLLHNLYGPGTRQVLKNAGLQRGMRVADLGCGVGLVTKLLAQLVGPQGLAIGVDFSSEQLAVARRQNASSARNTCFVQASAADTDLPGETFDLIYCRFLLIHLPDPDQALREMLRLLKPGGVVVCEDGDLTTSGSQPESALGAFARLWGQLGPHRGVDFTLGSRLFQMVLAAGFQSPEITYNQPVVARGENKRLLELSVAEAGPAFIAAGLISADELDRTLAEMQRLNLDETVLALMPRMSQVWARKPISPGRVN